MRGTGVAAAVAGNTDVRAANLRGLMGQYCWLLGSRLGSAALQGTTLLLLARWTSPVEFGVAAKTFGVLLVLGAVADLGLGGLLLRERSADPHTHLTPPILRVNLWTSAALALLVTGGLLLLGLYRSPTYLLLAPLGLWVAAEKNGDLWVNLATADGRTHLSAVNVLIRRIVTLAVFCGLAQLDAAVTLAFAIASMTGSVAANAVIRTQVDDRVERSAVAVAALCRSAFPFYLNTMAAQVRNVDVAIVSAVAGPLAGGIYAVPARLTSPLRMLPTALNPIIVRYSSLGTRAALNAVRRVSLLCMVAMPLLMVGVILTAPALVDAALGAAYASAVLPLRIICAGLMFAFAVSLQTSFLQGRGEEHFVGRVGAAIALYVIVAVATGAAFYGATGAAVAVSSSFVAHCLLLSARTRSAAKAISL